MRGETEREGEGQGGTKDERPTTRNMLVQSIGGQYGEATCHRASRFHCMSAVEKVYKQGFYVVEVTCIFISGVFFVTGIQPPLFIPHSLHMWPSFLMLQHN